VKFCPVHLAEAHRERAMVDRAEAARVALDRHIVGRVGEDHGGPFLAHQRREGFRIEGTAAQDSMAAEEPQIPDLADRRLGRDLGHGISRVVILLGHVIERGDPQIDLGHLEAGHLEAEIESEEREVLELLGQQPVVPGGDLGQPVVGDRKGASLGRGQVIETERRYLAAAELAASEQPAVTGDHVELGIDEHRDVKAEGLDAVGDLPDLLLAVEPRVRGVGFELVDRPVDYRNRGRKAGRLGARSAKVHHQRTPFLRLG
jgi:hypothetical protein